MDADKPPHLHKFLREFQASSLSGFRPRPVLFTAFLLILTGIIAASSLTNPTESSYNRIRRTGVIRIGYAPEPPFAYINEQGQITGESPEIARKIWAQLGVHQIEWIQMEFGSLIEQLRAGRIDQIAAGMFIRPERQKYVAFTTPSVCLTPALLVLAKNPYNLHSLSDIAHNPDMKLAVLAGSVEIEDAKNAGISEASLLVHPNPDLALASIRKGTAHALALSSLTIDRLAVENHDMARALPFTSETSQSNCAAFAFRLEDKRLCALFTSAFCPFIGSDSHRQLMYLFGFTDENLPPPANSVRD